MEIAKVLDKNIYLYAKQTKIYNIMNSKNIDRNTKVLQKIIAENAIEKNTKI